MITVSEFKGQKVGVFGLGKAGDAAVKSLLAGGASVYAWDDKCKGPDAQKHLLPYADWPWQELKALVLSPGIPLTHPKPHPVVALAKKHSVPVIGDIELLYRACPEARYVGITGTNGKSTTTTLIGHILKSAGLAVEVGGNLGTPALALAPLGKDGTYVLELSSYQLDLVHTTRFNVAVLLNITPDHLDRHGDMQGYVAAKMHIFERQMKEDTAVVAVDDEYTKKIAKQLPNPLTVTVNAMLDGKYDVKAIPTLTGRHNWQNAAVAYAAARACGVQPEVIYKAMQSFPGLRHRLQLVATISGVRFINDSKATNADATSNALAPYDTIYWILGGKPKAGGISTLTSYFSKIAHAFLIGEATEEFARTLEGKVTYTRCGTLDVAVHKAAALAFTEQKKDAVVLLSPACASFDQFKNFEERGDAFCTLIEKLSSPQVRGKHAS